MISAKEAIESPSRIEPARLEALPEAIADVVSELSAASAVLGASLHPTSAANLAALVRIMNSYYSNLIEGHHTRPRDIQGALEGQLDTDAGRRNLQLEAAAHVRVQAEIDRLAAGDALPEPASAAFVLWLHREFYKDAPDEMLRVGDGEAATRMTPGRWRSGSRQEVAVGRHRPPSSDRLEAFMGHFESRYRFAEMGRSARIMAVAAAHHRLSYIHPFPDGNGRVARLMSHAMALRAGIGAHGLWSVSRGLARGLDSRGDYKRMMDHADMPRQGDLDGRGNLSQRALCDFILWFLKVCLDQVTFMSELFDLQALAGRLRRYVERSETLRPEAAELLREALIRGQVERGEASRLTGLPERTARRVLNEVVADGLLASASPKGPVSLRFPATALESLFPRLYPES